MERRPLTVEHALLIALSATSLSALALALGMPALFLVIPLMIASGFCRVVRLPRPAAQVVHWSGLLAAAGKRIRSEGVSRRSPAAASSAIDVGKTVEAGDQAGTMRRKTAVATHSAAPAGAANRVA